MSGASNGSFFDSSRYNGAVRFDICGVKRTDENEYQMVRSATWSPEDGTRLESRVLYPNMFSDFNNKVIYVGAIEVRL